MSLPDAEALLANLAQALRGCADAEAGLIGIHSGGVLVAERLHEMLGWKLPLGAIDIAFYRDDFASRGLKPDVRPSEIPFDVAGRDIVLVDDVLYTGRTIRAALNVLFDYGRPRRVQLAALVDRGGRQLPICAQFVGGQLQVSAPDMVVVERAADGRLLLSLRGAGNAGP
jgi:pyrimidine operon attenuation protein/uracil phosphoribosyltransferase